LAAGIRANGLENEIIASVVRLRVPGRREFFTGFTQQTGGSDMAMREMIRQLLGVAVLAWLFAPPVFGQADIIHRYSFTNDASDSVGGANGTLMGNAIVSGGQLVLDGTPGTYLDISPIGPDIGNLNDATIEAWVTWDEPNNLYWERIFDFGNDTTTYMFLSTHPNAHGPRFAITIDGNGDESQVETGSPFPFGVETHIAITIDSVNQIGTMYVNGQVAGVIYGYTATPSAMGVTSNNYLGKSQWPDPYFNGSFNEFRIYGRALSAAEIAASYAGGPDGTPP
jgi:hypothetical protein